MAMEERSLEQLYHRLQITPIMMVAEKVTIPSQEVEDCQANIESCSKVGAQPWQGFLYTKYDAAGIQDLEWWLNWAFTRNSSLGEYVAGLGGLDGLFLHSLADG